MYDKSTDKHITCIPYTHIYININHIYTVHSKAARSMTLTDAHTLITASSTALLRQRETRRKTTDRRQTRRSLRRPDGHSTDTRRSLHRTTGHLTFRNATRRRRPTSDVRATYRTDTVLERRRRSQSDCLVACSRTSRLELVSARCTHVRGFTRAVARPQGGVYGHRQGVHRR